MVLTIAAFFFVLSIVVFVHEFGHFFLAKLNKVFVTTFSFGLGHKLIGKKIGDTEFVISAIPFGGYVKFAGETDEEDKDQRESERELDVPEEELYRNKNPLQKMSIVLAGPFMNMVLALVVYILSLWFLGIFVNPSTIVREVEEGSPALAAGFQEGDRIIEINGQPFEYWDEIDQLVTFEEGVKSSFVLERGQDTLTLELAPEYDSESGMWYVGIHSPLPPKVGNVKKDSPADKAGIRPGALILSVNDTTVASYRDLARIIHKQPGIPMKFEWELDGKVYTEIITPSTGEMASEGERLDVIKVGQIGIGNYFERKKISFVESVRYGTRAFVWILKAIIDFLGKLVTGKATIKAIGGPLRVGVMAGDMIRWGFSYLINFLAFFSLNLAIINLFPLLPFDGGHFVVYTVELVSRKRINRKVQRAMAQIGYIFLILLMIFILFVDVLNIFS